MEKLEKCVFCSSDVFTDYLKTKDFFLSNEQFVIQKCDQCGLLFVNPRPTPEEIQKYYKSDNYISHTGSKKKFSDKIYHLVRKINHFYKYNLIKKHCRKGKILDIGCATGEFLHYFKKRGWETTGIEPNEKARIFAQSNYALNVFEENALNIFEKNSFEVITMWHVLEHVHNPCDLIKKLYYLLKNQGIAVIAVPNPYSKDAKIYEAYWAGYDLPRHLFHFSSDVLKKLFIDIGFRFVEKKPMFFDAFYISLLSEEYKSGRKKYFKAFINGLKSNLWALKNNNEFSSQIFIFKKEN